MGIVLQMVFFVVICLMGFLSLMSLSAHWISYSRRPFSHWRTGYASSGGNSYLGTGNGIFRYYLANVISDFSWVIGAPQLSGQAVIHIPMLRLDFSIVI